MTTFQRAFRLALAATLAGAGLAASATWACGDAPHMTRPASACCCTVPSPGDACGTTCGAAPAAPEHQLSVQAAPLAQPPLAAAAALFDRGRTGTTIHARAATDLLLNAAWVPRYLLACVLRR
jgi:hypothetical protein